MGLYSRFTEPGTAQHLAEHCRDDYCHRLPCRMFKAGYRKGYEEGHAAGYADGYDAGFQAGWAAKPPDIVYITVKE